MAGRDCAAIAVLVLLLVLSCAGLASAQTPAWNGFYAGAHAGGATGDLGEYAGENLEDEGAAGGLHAGFN
jgi:hypothetical protein